jgi:hypothetical protein
MSPKKLKVRKRGKKYSVPKKHHLDQRADKIIATEIDAENDELMTTHEVAVWFGVSDEWLEIGRSKGYGPPFTRVGPHSVRYLRSKCREYLQARTYASTAEYAR